MCSTFILSIKRLVGKFFNCQKQTAGFFILDFHFIFARKIVRIFIKFIKFLSIPLRTKDRRKINFKFALKSGILSRKIYTRAIVPISYSPCNESMLNRLCAYIHKTRHRHNDAHWCASLPVSELIWRIVKKLASFINPPLIVHKSQPINYKTKCKFPNTTLPNN